MEEKDFPGLCRLLAASRARVNLPETILFHQENIDLWVYSDAGGGLRKRPPGEEGVRNVHDACRYFQDKSTQQPHSSAPVCYLLSKTARTTLDSSQIDSLLAEKKENFNRVLGLQEYKEPKNQGQSWFAYWVKFEPGRGYLTKFLRVKGGETEPENCPRLQHKAKDTAQVVLSAIEEVRLKRVQELSLDLMQDSQGALWVMGSTVCILCTPGIPVQPDSLPLKDKPFKLGSKQRKPDLKQSESTAAPSKEKSKVVFKRGQLRSLESNLSSPLRILSPEYPPSTPQAPEQPIKQTVTSDALPVDSPLRSINTTKTKSFLVKISQKSDRFFNPNFQELLVMGYLKKLGIYPSQHPSTFKDEFYKDLDGTEGDSPAKMARRLTQRLEGLVLSEVPRDEGSVESYDDSGSSDPSDETDPVPPLAPFLPILVKKPVKQFNTSKRHLYMKSTREFTTPLQPVLSPRKPFSVLRFSHERMVSLDEAPATMRTPYGSWSHRERGVTKWQSVSSLKS